MGFPEDTALGIEVNRQPHIYKMNECDWWCDYSIEEAKNNYAKFTGTKEEWSEFLPQELIEEDIDKYKYIDDETYEKITFKEELEKRILANDVPSFFASTEY